MRALVLALACLALSPLAWAEARLTQFSVIDALLAGVYDGPTTVGDLKAAGNCGLGTFNGLDGELIMLDRVVYQVGHDGSVNVMPEKTKTPFAVVCDFKTDFTAPLFAVASFKDFENSWSALMNAPKTTNPKPPPTGPNQFYAIQLTGKFTTIKARSVPKQTPPYRPLGEVVADQNVFNFAEIEGTMVGFYCPPYAKGVNVPGWHFHFISKDRQLGGHVLDFSIKKEAQVSFAVQVFNQLDLRLPEDHEFAYVDLNPDRSEALEKVERGRTD